MVFTQLFGVLYTMGVLCIEFDQTLGGSGGNTEVNAIYFLLYILHIYYT